MFRRRHRRPPDPPSQHLTERELDEMENQLRRSLQTFVRKVLFIDKETKKVLVIEDEDRRALANAGIDQVLEEFTDYMRTKVKPNDTP